MGKFKVLIVYPNLSMMLTPSCAVGIFTKILKNKGYIVELFDCTPYDSNLEFLSEPLPVTRAKTLMNSRSFDSSTLFGEAKKNLKNLVYLFGFKLGLKMSQQRHWKHLRRPVVTEFHSD